MKEDRFFVDTNVLVYAYDETAAEKHEQAKEIVQDLWETRNGVLSMQVLQEFFITVTRKIPKPADIDTAADIVRDYLQWRVVILRGQSIISAIDIQRRHLISFWDALILQAAVEGDAACLLTEDLAHGANLYDVEIRNPFK
ncbi:MAG: PIN domain-containing protein [Deltaproteobacteria bacterium]|nr:PIN domain-containing protein [Deltaproteobacteria bacterium]